jgi:hypothetical protein
MPGTALQERLALLRMPPDITTELEVRELVWTFVDNRKAAGWPPERIIVAIKQIVRDAGLHASTMVAKRGGRLTSVDDLLDEMVGWCIHRYFGNEQRRDSVS